MADAGDALDDANFEHTTANGAILRLTKVSSTFSSFTSISSPIGCVSLGLKPCWNASLPSKRCWKSAAPSQVGSADQRARSAIKGEWCQRWMCRVECCLSMLRSVAQDRVCKGSSSRKFSLHVQQVSDILYSYIEMLVCICRR